MESFGLKVPILGPHLPFHERNAVTRAEFTIVWHSTSKGFRAQMVRLFWSLPVFGRKMLRKSSKCQGPRTI